MDDKELRNGVGEHQKIGFLITALHNLSVKYDISFLVFCQTNREGINSEDSATLSQSDRLAWMASNVSLYKEKTPEEIAENPDGGNRKLYPILARHGEGLPAGDYINYRFEKQYNRIIEIDTRYNLEQKKKQQNKSMVEMNGGDSVNV
jgi:hypothetical protein